MSTWIFTQEFKSQKIRVSCVRNSNLILNFRQEVEELGEKLNFSANLQNFHSVSLGQGQEVVAEEALDIAAQSGHWVILQVSEKYKQTVL